MNDIAYVFNPSERLIALLPGLGERAPETGQRFYTKEDNF
jgi:hypothetical protein